MARFAGVAGVKAQKIAGTLALIFALGWFAHVELRLLGLPTSVPPYVMRQFSKLKPDGAASVFTFDEVYDQMRRLPHYLEQQTPSTIPGVVPAIVGFELLRRARARPKDDR